MYLLALPEVNHIGAHNSYKALCNLAYLNGYQEYNIFPVENNDYRMLLNGLRSYDSAKLYEILITIGGEFESDDNESWLEERYRLGQLIMENLFEYEIKEFEVESQAAWKDLHGKDKQCAYAPGKYIPNLL